jgi:hypothetical protein
MHVLFIQPTHELNMLSIVASLNILHKVLAANGASWRFPAALRSR